MPFQLHSAYQPMGDQPKAIDQLTQRLVRGEKHSVLLGVTGSGKTFTAANIIQNVQKPTLVIAHNKTLAAQLYQEFRDFFPNNAVSYFVSYYDYYQPEAYIPTTDTYIEKEATINDEIDKLRLASTANLLTRPDSIVIASVSCIYNLGSPVEYGRYMLTIVEGEVISQKTLLLQLANLQYDRSEAELRRGSYRLRGDMIQIWPAYEDFAIRIDTLENQITKLDKIDPISGNVIPEPPTPAFAEDGTPLKPRNKRMVIYPAKHYVVDPKSQQDAFAEIREDLQRRLTELKAQDKMLEAYRLEQKVNYDLEMIQEFGFTIGIENYSRYFDGRQPGEAPFTLMDYFAESCKQFGFDSYLTIVDESHITLPQVRGMHAGDQARKETLIEYGFRLPSALDNRPLKFEEFLERIGQTIHVSATPNDWEISHAGGKVVEQLIRPTGLVDPEIELRRSEGQIEDLVVEIIRRKAIGQRVLVTTLTKRMAEALTEYLNNTEKIDALLEQFTQRREAEKSQDFSEQIIYQGEELPVEEMQIGPIDEKFFSRSKLLTPEARGIILAGNYPKVAYLHADVETLERSDILDDLRRGIYDVVVGINLLREGLDLPEVTLVAILDADKEGFLRSHTSLIQTMGRAARHAEGRAVLYADRLTGSMQKAIAETQRRRRIQVEHNLAQGISPTTIAKPIREKMIKQEERDRNKAAKGSKGRRGGTAEPEPQGMIVQLSKTERVDLGAIVPSALTPFDRKKLAGQLKRRMNQAAKDMDFELAAVLRDTIAKLQ